MLRKCGSSGGRATTTAPPQVSAGLRVRVEVPPAPRPCRSGAEPTSERKRSSGAESSEVERSAPTRRSRWRWRPAAAAPAAALKLGVAIRKRLGTGKWAMGIGWDKFGRMCRTAPNSAEQRRTAADSPNLVIQQQQQRITRVYWSAPTDRSFGTAGGASVGTGIHRHVTCAGGRTGAAAC